MAPLSGFEKVKKDVGLMLWKRKIEYLRNKWDIARVIAPPMMFMVMLLLFYEAFPNLFHLGGMEEYLMPISSLLFFQRVVVSITAEKSKKLIESMKMMGLNEGNYWLSYFISEGIIVGFIVSTLTMFLSIGPVFRYVNPAIIWAFMFIYYMSAVTKAFLVVALFDKPQTASQAALLIIIACYAIFLALDVSYASHGLQRVLCLVPSLALQLGSSSTKLSYEGIGLGEIMGWLTLDILIYGFLAWYVTQVRPSEYGLNKPWYFIFNYNFWMKDTSMLAQEASNPLGVSLVSEDHLPKTKGSVNPTIPVEAANEGVLGQPSVRVGGLVKRFGSHVAVNNLSFDMYENQILALLGHNGAGKTTTINMLTGLMPQDSRSQGETSIYGKSILTDMDSCRTVMGVCPQHDVLFELLNVEEHIMFFSQLKGFTEVEAEAEVRHYGEVFKLTERLDHLGMELSGGQRRKLSVSIAVCGGSKFVVLDEPTAGMDPVARRDLWDLLKVLRKGRTMLLTTHYMDEADTLGNRIGIMSLGKLQCLGTPQFLKTNFGAGYRLTMSLKTRPGVDGRLERDPSVQLEAITGGLEKAFPGCTPEIGGLDDVEAPSLRRQSITSRNSIEDGGVNRNLVVTKQKKDSNRNDDTNLVCNLSFTDVTKFGTYFYDLEKNARKWGVDSFGVTITTLEDVFMVVGGDHTVEPDFSTFEAGIGDEKYEFSLATQIYGIAMRKFKYAMNDFVSWCMVVFPIAATIAAAILYSEEIITSNEVTNNIVFIAIFMFSMLMVPGLLAEFIVSERQSKLRTVLTVMGCDFRAYWVGSFISDFCLLSIVSAVLMSMWWVMGMDDFKDTSLCYFILIVFQCHIISFAYMMSYVFATATSAIFVTPSIIIGLLILPNITLSFIVVIFDISLNLFSLSFDVAGGTILWGLALLTPHGNMFAAMLDATYDLSDFIQNFPPAYASIIIAIFETVLFMYITYEADKAAVSVLNAKAMGEDPTDEQGVELMEKLVAATSVEDGTSALELSLALEKDDDVDADVLAEAERVKASKSGAFPLKINGLRKVFQPKIVSRKPVVAARGVHFAVERNEIFGLLGANGAGKTTTLNMLTRHLTPTAGDAEICGMSVLTGFKSATKFLGVVTQDNSLWELLSVEDHLRLFARLRGVPEERVDACVLGVINQLELMPHRSKLAGRLSGGMKRKLCVAIALIGNPDVCLLDEPSAGLDPVSRRNLWEVILRTMTNRAVVLTTHSMEEAEALCDRIGIMVHGQLRALGTKQSLKTKFGGHYELVVKLGDNSSGDELKTDREVTALHEFVLDMFPSAERETDSGMVTYRVPSTEMSLGKAFTLIEKKREQLNIETYSISQPTLERVFIDTVQRHEVKIPGTPQLSRSSMGGVDRAALDQLNDASVTVSEAEAAAEATAAAKSNAVSLAVGACGCTIPTIRKIVLYSFISFIFWCALGVITGTMQLFALGYASFVVTIVSIFIWQCTCCQPISEDE